MSALRLPSGYRGIVLDEIDSTNEEARRRAAGGDAGNLWIAARVQTAGRGRRGRAWVSPAGNLMCTLLLRPDMTPADAARLSFVAALAVADAVAAFAPGARIEVKWPNDVLLDRRKVAGILLESSARAEGRLEYLSVGVGINLASHPDGTPFPAISLAARGFVPPQPERALERLAAAWAEWSSIHLTNGFAAIRDAWVERAAGLGGAIEVRLPNETFAGRFESLDEDGALVVAVNGSLTRKVTAGEVFLAGTGV